MKPRHIVLIDLENVQPTSLAVLEAACFEIFVCVGSAQTKIPFEMAASLQRMGDRARYIRIAGQGANALDFHIAFYVGQLAAQGPEAQFHIRMRGRHARCDWIRA